MINKLKILFFIITINLSVYGQVYEFKSLNQEDGLPSSSINVIYQDSRDYIWIGTDGSGITLYDGENFKLVNRTHGLPVEFASDIIEDDNKNIIIGTKYDGIKVFNGSTIIHKYNAITKDLSSNFVYKFIKKKDKIIAITLKEIVEISKDYKIKILYQQKNEFDHVNSFFEISNNKYLITTNKGIFEVYNSKLSRYLPEKFNKERIVAFKKNNTTFIGTVRGELFIYENRQLIDSKIIRDTNKSFFSIKTIFVTNQNEIWLSNNNDNGICKIKNNEVSYFNSKNGFEGTVITNFFEDKNKTLYIGTIGYGLYILGSQHFIDYSNNEFTNNPAIFSILKSNSDLYIGIRNLGIYQYTINKDNSIHYVNNYKTKYSYASLKSKDGKLIFSTSDGLLIIDNKIRKTINLNKYTENIPIDIKTICQTDYNNYFVGTYGNGIMILDSNFNYIKSLHLKYDNISSISQINSNKWFISTSDGLYILTYNKNQYSISKKLFDENISNAVKDKYNNHWFIANNNLYCFANNKFLKYSKKNLFSSSTIYTLQSDNYGNLYLGTNLGIERIKANQYGKITNIRNYNSKSGFTGLETNMRAQFKDEEGNLWVGTAKGLYKIVPKFSDNENSKFKIEITELKLFNQENDWQTKNKKNKWFNVPPPNYIFKTNENSISFKFLSANNPFTNNSLYQYKLVGLRNSKWSNSTNLNEVILSNLNYGSYTFKVKMVDGTGKTISNIASYSFEIEKPYYAKWWFIIAIAITLFAVFSIMFRKSSKHSKNFIRNHSIEKISDHKYLLYILYLGILIQLMELFISISEVRERDTLIFNIVFGCLLILIYILSKYLKIIKSNIKTISYLLFVIYSISTIYRLIIYPNSISSILEFIVVFSISFNIVTSIKQYWYFVLLFSVLTIILFLAGNIQKVDMVAYLCSIFIIAIINQLKHTISNTTKDQLLFTNDIVNKGTSLVVAVNNFGEVVYCNETINSILGYTQEEVSGMNYWRLVDDKEFSSSEYTIKEELYVRKLKCKNNEYKYIQWKDFRFSEEIIVGIGQDVTAQVEVQNQYKKLVESANDIIFETNIEGEFTFLNDFTEKLTGYSKKELLGKHFTKFIREDYIDIANNYFKTKNIDNENVEPIEFPIITKNGSEIWISQKTSKSRNIDGQTVGFSAIAHDITKEKIQEFEQQNQLKKNAQYNSIVNQLISERYSRTDKIDDIINHIIQTVSEGTNINKVSLWNHFGDKLVCSNSYDTNNKAFTKGDECLKSKCPIYFNEIETKKILISSNVSNDHFTQEFVDNYYKANSIKSIIDVAILINGEIASIMCFEKTNDAIKWDNDDINFARSIADIVSLAIESHKRLGIEIKLAEKSEILSAIAKSAQKYLIDNNYKTIFSEVFEEIGQATNVDRIYFYKNETSSEYFDLNLEWVKKNSKKGISKSRFEKLYYSELKPILEVLNQNKIFNSNVSKIEDNIIESRFRDLDIKTSLLFPIFIKNLLHGYIGFDDCVSGRTWANAEIGVLQILANNIASAIERIENEKLLQESESRFKLLADNIPGTVYLSEIDKSFTKVYINDEIEELTGYSKNDFLNNSITLIDLVHPDDKEKALFETNNAIESLKPFHLIYRLKRKDESYIWVEEFGEGIVKDNKVTFIEGILLDITQKVEVEAQIKARELAEESNRAKSEFLANMSHEIRTPLNAIIGFTSLLKDTKINSKQEEYISTVNISANILLDVVNDILDFSKIETGKFELDYHKINLSKTIQNIEDIIKFDIDKKNLKFKLNYDNAIPKFILFDDLRLKQILLNLLSNAIKFTNKGEIELVVKLLTIDKNISKLQFEVIDTGIGINIENFNKILQPFSQEDNSTSRKYGGTGLGLSISNKLLHLMGSSLQLRSNIKKGSVFFFEVDATVLNETIINETEYNDLLASINSKDTIVKNEYKILIVEDNKINMLLTKVLVKKLIPNSIIIEAENGQIAIEKFQIENPDIILMDVQMPVLNGYEASIEIRKTNQQIPIIAITAGIIQGEKEKCFEHGMSDYISKPIDKEVFNTILLKYLSLA